MFSFSLLKFSNTLLLLRKGFGVTVMRIKTNKKRMMMFVVKNITEIMMKMILLVMQMIMMMMISGIL